MEELDGGRGEGEGEDEGEKDDTYGGVEMFGEFG